MRELLTFHPPVIAHRGASAYAPENTLIAFTKAAQLGMHWVEFDVMQAACGEPVIFHDEELDRTTNGSGRVDAYPYAYLGTLDAGAWFQPVYAGERIPSLALMLDFLKTSKMCANIEIKPFPGHEESLVLRVVDEMAAYLATSTATVLFSSFSIETLRILRRNSPNSLIGLLIHEWRPDWEKLCESLSAVSLHVNHVLLTFKRAQEIKAAGKTLLCYTVNDPLRANELYSWGVDAVFSDVPDKIVMGLTHLV
ncbi:MAG: hypothetical protein A3E85_00165 [Gammaproteobacteria bacterium RIFCSPHIGHO2_12_FULL_45_12]|nr:MAG: hypothetical protein A3E85_00165 [Gammaproteobacteria bacterium RIFCSPHIGHO2_12_FULL_45_12]